MGDLNGEFEGTWFNTLDPFYGYLKIEPYKNEDEGGECLAVVHAKHGRNEPPIWYRGVWKPTDLGWEVIAGPFHWKQIAMFTTPPTRNTPNLRQYFRSELNGWGSCNMGKLGEKEEQEFIDSLGQQLGAWQTEPTYWRDYPSATWPESKKYMVPSHTFDGAGAPPKPMPGVALEDQVTHNGGQPIPPQTAMPNIPPFPIPSDSKETGQAGLPKPGGGDGGGGEQPPPDGGGQQPPPPDNGGGNGGQGGGEQPPNGGGGGGGQQPPPPNNNGGGGAQQPAPQQQPQQQNGGQQQAQQGKPAPANSGAGQQQQAKAAQPAQNGGTKQQAQPKSGGSGADKDGDGHVIDDVISGRVFKKDK